MGHMLNKNFGMFSFLTLFSAIFFFFTMTNAYADCSTTTPPTCVYVSPKAPNNKVSVTPTFDGASPTCEVITNNCPASVMVPTANENEWSSFVSSDIANGGCISLAGCGGPPGVCGSDNGTTNLTSPPVNLCASGSTLDNNRGGLQGGISGPWTWYCLANGSDSPQCSAAEAGGTCSAFYLPSQDRNCTQPNVPYGTVCTWLSNKCFQTQTGPVCETDCYKCMDNPPANPPPPNWYYTGCFGGAGCSGCVGGI